MLQMYAVEKLNFETMIFFEGNLHSTFHIQPYIQHLLQIWMTFLSFCGALTQKVANNILNVVK